MHERAFAGTAFADNGDTLTSFDTDIDILQSPEETLAFAVAFI